MAQTKTFSQIIDEGYTYPAIIPQDLQAVIYDWYQDRHVADDEKFPLWFSRILKADYEQYKQILRIEPGYAQYDWLVTQYRELQREEEGTLENATTSSATGTRRVEGTESTTKTDDKSVTRTVDMDEDVDDSTTVTRGGTTGVSGSGSKTGTETVEHDATSDTTTSGTTSGNTSDTTETTRDINARAMQKSLPMSNSYASGSIPAGDLPVLDWQAATGQEQTVTDDDTNTQSSGTSAGSTSGTEHNVLDGQDKTTYNISDTNGSTTTTSESESRTGDRSVSRDTTDTTVTDDSQTGSRSSSDVTTDSSSGSTTLGQESSGRTREIYTGRQGQIANIMEQAKQFIASTNAWEWFMTRIDTVFMGVYDA